MKTEFGRGWTSKIFEFLSKIGHIDTKTGTKCHGYSFPGCASKSC